MAMLLEEAKLLESCEIIATDLSARALSRARAGLYGSRSLRAMNDGMDPLVRSLADRWIARETGNGGSVARVARRMVDAVSYRQLNLLDDVGLAALGRFDLILCRNVLIYFADDTVRRIVSSLCSALAPSGRIVVGASESLLRFGTILHCEERGGAFFYAKDP